MGTDASCSAAGPTSGGTGWRLPSRGAGVPPSRCPAAVGGAASVAVVAARCDRDPPPSMPPGLRATYAQAASRLVHGRRGRRLSGVERSRWGGGSGPRSWPAHRRRGAGTRSRRRAGAQAGHARMKSAAAFSGGVAGVFDTCRQGARRRRHVGRSTRRLGRLRPRMCRGRGRVRRQPPHRVRLGSRADEAGGEPGGRFGAFAADRYRTRSPRGPRSGRARRYRPTAQTQLMSRPGCEPRMAENEACEVSLTARTRSANRPPQSQSQN